MTKHLGWLGDLSVVNTTIVALLLFVFFGFPAIHKQGRTEAWNVLNSSIEQTGNGGRIIALQNLVKWQNRRDKYNWASLADYLIGQKIDLNGVKLNNAFPYLPHVKM